MHSEEQKFIIDLTTNGIIRENIYTTSRLGLHISLATLNPLFKGRLHTQPQPWWLMGALLINFEVREKLHLACKQNKFVVEVEGVEEEG